MDLDELLTENDQLEEAYEVEKTIEVVYRHPTKEDLPAITLRVHGLRVIKGPHTYVARVEGKIGDVWRDAGVPWTNRDSAEGAIAQVLGFLRKEVPKFHDLPEGVDPWNQ